MPSNRHLGRSASQVAFRRARGLMAELYCKGYHPDRIIHEVINQIAKDIPDIRVTLLTDLSRAVMFTAHRPGTPSVKDIQANKDFAAADNWEA